MSITKEFYRWSINSSVAKVAKARETCSNAMASIQAAVSEIPECWQGEAAEAMEETLLSIRSDVERARSLIAAAETKVQSRGAYLLENWSDPDGGEEKGGNDP